MKKNLHILLLLLTCSVVVSLITAFDAPTQYAWLFLLPLSFAIQSIVFNRVYKYLINNLVVMIVLCVYFVRNVISPLVLRLSGYYSIVVANSESSVICAIVLMIFETTCVFALLYVECKRIATCTVPEKSNFIIKQKSNIFFAFALSLILMFMIISWFTVPEIKHNYITFFNDDVVTLNTIALNEGVERGGVQRIMLTMFLLLFKIIRIILPTAILIFIKNKFPVKGLGLLISYLVISLQMLMISGNTMDAFIAMVVLFIVLLKLYPKNKKGMLVTGGSGILLVLILLIVGKGNSIAKTNNLSAFLQAYFPGVCNLAGVFDIPKGLDKVSSLLADIYTTMPFRNSLFNYEASFKTVEIFNIFNSVRGQIIPFIGEAYYYIGLFAPIVPLLIIKIAFIYDKKAKNASNIYEYVTYVYIAIYFSCSTVLYHITILGSYVLSVMIPMLLIIALAHRKNSRGI